MKQQIKVVIILMFLVLSCYQAKGETLREKYKKSHFMNGPIPIGGEEFYLADWKGTSKELSDELNLPIDSLHSLVTKGVLGQMVYLNIDVNEEGYTPLKRNVDAYFAPPYDATLYSLNRDKPLSAKLMMFLPVHPDNIPTPQFLPELEMMKQQVISQSYDEKLGHGYKIFVHKGQDWAKTVALLRVSIGQLRTFNPDMDFSQNATEDCIIFLPQYAINHPDSYDKNSISADRDETLIAYYNAVKDGRAQSQLTIKDRLRQGSRLFHYDRCQIEGEIFWSLNNLSMDATANKISEAIGIPIDTLKMYCNYVAELEDYEGEKKRFNEVAQYFLSHPNITREEMENISRNLYGSNYYVSLYIPENPIKTSLIKPSIPAEVESVKTLKKFFRHKPLFKCKETGVTLTLTYSQEDKFAAYVDGKKLGEFEVDTRKDQPNVALIGLPWLNGWGPAPMLLYLNGKNTKCVLMPVQGEENLRYNSQGYLQPGRTGNTNWMQLSLSSDGVSFTPVDYKPSGETFWFIGFSNN